MMTIPSTTNSQIAINSTSTNTSTNATGDDKQMNNLTTLSENSTTATTTPDRSSVVNSTESSLEDSHDKDAKEISIPPQKTDAVNNNDPPAALSSAPHATSQAKTTPTNSNIPTFDFTKVDNTIARQIGIETTNIGRYGAVGQDPEHDKPLTKMDKGHYIYRKGPWDGPPIVIPQFRLIFFTIPKVGCTVFKQLFRRMKGYRDWGVGDDPRTHEPSRNGLDYLHTYSESEALEMMTSENWTRAIFVREPRDRILSAYLDKGFREGSVYVKTHCCPRRRLCEQRARESFEGFLQVASQCLDPHWMAQSNRMTGRYWQYINFVGHIETAQVDTRRLLERIGAWRRYGANGWGKLGNEPIFATKASVRHATLARDHLAEYFTPEIEGIVRRMYGVDFENPLFNFTGTGNGF